MAGLYDVMSYCYSFGSVNSLMRIKDFLADLRCFKAAACRQLTRMWREGKTQLRDKHLFLFFTVKLRYFVALLLFSCVAAAGVGLAMQAHAGEPVEAERTVGVTVEERPLERSGFYDPANPMFRMLQQAADALIDLPRDKTGRVDWMKALRSGIISPRSDLQGNKPMEVLDLDVILKNTKEMPYVKFPHNSHTQWLACSNCHDKIFVAKAGANPISMDKIFRGQYCGTCHDRIAFITHYSCERCHSVPHGKIKAWW